MEEQREVSHIWWHGAPANTGSWGGVEKSAIWSVKSALTAETARDRSTKDKASRLLKHGLVATFVVN